VSLPDNQVPPLSEIYFYLTGACNLNCRHCWIDPAFETTTENYLPRAKLKEIVQEAIPLGLTRVKLTGGEPFLHPEICGILHDLSEMKLSIRMETNATLIGKKEARALRAAATFVAVSIDGPTADCHDDLRGVKGAFGRALQGVLALRREKLRFQVITCLHKRNSDYMREMVRFAREIGASSLKINPIMAVARSVKMEQGGELLAVPEILKVCEELTLDTDGLSGFKLFFDIPPAFKSLQEIKTDGFGTCGILNILGVLHNGRGSLCGIGEQVAVFDFGDLLELGVRKVWEENALLQELRSNLPDNLRSICGKCMLKRYCLGKCVARTYYEQGDLFGGFSFCQQALDQGFFPKSRLVH